MILLLKIKDENTISRICEDGQKHDFKGVLVAKNGFQKHRQKHRGGAISPQSGDIAKLRQLRQLTPSTLPRLERGGVDEKRGREGGGERAGGRGT